MPDRREPVTRTSIVLLNSMWEEIEAYRERESILTTADAVRRLLRDALRAAKERRTE
jgi:hypothetical protein